MAIIRFKKTLLFISLLSLFLSGFSLAENTQTDDVKIKLFSTDASYQTTHDFEKDITNVQWQSQKGQSIYLTQSTGVSWVKVRLTNSSSTNLLRLIEIATTKIQTAEVYELFTTTNDTNNNEIIITPLYKNQTHLAQFIQRPINYRNLVYPINIDQKTTRTLLFKIYHSHDVKLNFQLWEELQFHESTNRELVFFGMIYGALLMIIIYNFFIYLSLREKTHLLFVLFGIFTGLFISIQEGHFLQFIAMHSLWPIDIFYAFITAMMSLFFTFFSICFLDIERWSIWLYRLMLAMGALSVIFLLLLGITPQPVIFSHYTLLIIITLYGTAIGLGIFVWHRGVSSAGFFTLAIFLCNLGLLMEFVSHLSFMPWSKLTYSYVSIGNTAMALVFAFALADKMRILQNEKLSTSIKLVKMTEDKAQNNLEIYKARLHEVELEKETNEVKIENRARSEFLATMSHEIRTPMNGVLGMAELLEDTEMDPKQRRYVASISNSAKALLNAINDLLDYSKIESGKMELESKLFNLEKTLDDCITIFALRAAEVKVDLIGQIQPNTPIQFKGDADKIRQIILNLLGTAFNFTSKGNIFINIYPTGKTTVNSIEIRFDITNKNIVLNDADKESLFSPFQDLLSNDRKHHGHELGLTVSRQLTELMQGQIGVDTNIEENSTTLWFTSRLLLPHSDEEKELPDRSKILGGRRLLICDTNNDFIAAIETITQSWGMKTCAVSSSKEVVKKLLDDEKAYQILMIAEECLTPEVQLAVRQSNLENNFIASIILTTHTRFAITKEDMKKRSIQFVLEKPYTIALLYLSLLKSMGVESTKTEQIENEKLLSVIIAEDNDVNLMVIEGLLKKLKIYPTSAHNGKQAVDIYTAAKEPIELIFMDCEMPEMDGYEATQAIRAYDAEHELNSIIIGLSAHSTTEYKDRALEAGMNDFLTKPVTTEDIEQVVERLRAGFYHAEKAEY